MCSKKNKKPMYCIKCGTKQEEGEKFCPKCGTPFIVEDNFVSESESETNLKQEANNDFKVRFKKGLYVAFSLIVPLLGLILYFIKRKKDKKLAKSILICTIIGAAFNVVIYYNNYDDEFESSYYESNNESYETPTSDMQDEKLAKVLKRIAGDYELCENLGVQGFNVWSTMRINSDGTGWRVDNYGDKIIFNEAYLNDDNTISFACSDGSGERYKILYDAVDYTDPRIDVSGIVIDVIRVSIQQTPYCENC